MPLNYIYRVCGKCGGDGVISTPSSTPPYPVEDNPCEYCVGTGYNYWGVLSDEKLGEE